MSALDWKWMLENSDAKVSALPATGVEAEHCRRALEQHYGASRFRAMREFAHLARSPQDGWRAAVQAVRDGDPCMMLE